MFERGRYGVEWTPKPKDEESSALGRLVVIVVLLAILSLGWTLVSRFRASAHEAAVESEEAERIASANAPPPAVTNAPSAEPAFEAPETAIVHRPPKVRNLLLRLEEAEKRQDIEMAVTTIEAIRALPGSPAADLDDALARRLGALNMHRLFVEKCAQWVATVTVRGGDSASRIAAEHGSTFASLAKLNRGDLDHIRAGQQLVVLNHPRFSLVVHIRTRTADLSLNGKFFKRYDLPGPGFGAPGANEVSMPVRAFWRGLGVDFSPDDRAELELLMPKGAPVLVSEI